MRKNTYTPADGDTMDILARKARLCGLDLNPNDRSANWIDVHENAHELVECYHEGQEERYENEDW